MNTPFLSPATAAKLNGDIPVGTRHATILEIALDMVGNGWADSAIFAELRHKFPEDKTDKELYDAIHWAKSRNPSPSVPTPGRALQAFSAARHFKPPPAIPQRTPEQNASWWLSGAKDDPLKLSQKSQLQIPENKVDALVLLLEMLYLGSDNLNIVCKYLQDDAGKAKPNGGGKTITRDKWVDLIRKDGIPQSKAGAWFRPNPCKPVGSGADGAVTDSDVVSYRFMLIESDSLPLDIQCAMLSRFKLPISAILMSGGLSVHAWVRLDAKTDEEFSSMATDILTALKPFGIDTANKNPSRLSRLPGAVRTIGGVDGGCQTLIQLNPGKPALTPAGLIVLKESLLFPHIEEKPFRKLVADAIPRYEHLMLNQGKLGVQTGFRSFDKVSGGLKPGGYTLIAAQTGVGKTTIALNIMNRALHDSVGVVFFSLEMSSEDVTDMLFSLNCNIDRNHFNTGEFTEQEIASMAKAVPWIQKLPLWVDDDPSIVMDRIKKRVLQLKSENRIGLVVVDYAQLVLPDVSINNREQAVAEVALGLRLIGREASIPMIVLSQLNDDNKVRESRKLSHEAANLFVLSRDSESLSDPNMTLRIVKGRKIPSNPIKLHMDARFCRIVERDQIESEDIPNRSHWFLPAQPDP